jgi:lactate dehydrogenase-like 2-hydroxyacid dehydrogenase
MINADVINNKFKKNPIIVNTSRGMLIDVDAVIKGLSSGNIRGYLTDVLLQYGKRKENDDIKINQIIDIKDEFKHNGNQSSSYMKNNPRKKKNIQNYGLMIQNKNRF